MTNTPTRRALWNALMHAAQTIKAHSNFLGDDRWSASLLLEASLSNPALIESLCPVCGADMSSDPEFDPGFHLFCSNACAQAPRPWQRSR